MVGKHLQSSVEDLDTADMMLLFPGVRMKPEFESARRLEPFTPLGRY